MSSQCPVSDLSALLCTENLSRWPKFTAWRRHPQSLLSKQKSFRSHRAGKGDKLWLLHKSVWSQKLVTGGTADGFIAKSMGEFKTPALVGIVIGIARANSLLKLNRAGRARVSIGPWARPSSPWICVPLGQTFIAFSGCRSQRVAIETSGGGCAVAMATGGWSLSIRQGVSTAAELCALRPSEFRVCMYVSIPAHCTRGERRRARAASRRAKESTYTLTYLVQGLQIFERRSACTH